MATDLPMPETPPLIRAALPSELACHFVMPGFSIRALMHFAFDTRLPRLRLRRRFPSRCSLAHDHSPSPWREPQTCP